MRNPFKPERNLEAFLIGVAIVSVTLLFSFTWVSLVSPGGYLSITPQAAGIEKNAQEISHPGKGAESANMTNSTLGEIQQR
jgi:hypothetical protein